MRKILLNIFLLLLCISLQGRSFNTGTLVHSDIDGHLGRYAKINQNHHDNIDDEPHTHAHKHSENGEEHEHHHDHNKVSHSEVQLSNSSDSLFTTSFVFVSRKSFLERNLFSKFYPDQLFRPPIV